MSKEQILKELEKFNDFKFFEEDHHYEFKNKRVGISVTSLIDNYTQPFARDKIAEKTALKNYKLNLDTGSHLPDTTEEVLKEWNYKNQWACFKGSNGHDFAQSLWNNKIYYSDQFDSPEGFKIVLKSIYEQATNFYNDYKDILEHISDEFIIGSEEYDIASAIDHLFLNKNTGGLVLVDYKTNSVLGGYNDPPSKRKYIKKMKVPLQKLDDDALHHYYLQLSIYKFLLEKYTDLRVSEMYIVYMSENIGNYEIIDIPYLKKEVKKILENRRVKNMNSVPILLIGKSGSGKSTSLRNFTKDEIAVINVLGKPLPFKSDIKTGVTNDYTQIVKAIKETPKKVIVIDDANYLLTSEFMNKVSVKGYDKYNEMADHMYQLVNFVKTLEGGKTVYFVFHEDTDEFGNIKPKTIGKLLDDKVNLQGMFTICIRAMFENNNYIFRLKTNGQDCVKTPFGMFEEDEMENDLKKFDSIVREYYELDKKSEEK